LQALEEVLDAAISGGEVFEDFDDAFVTRECFREHMQDTSSNKRVRGKDLGLGRQSRGKRARVDCRAL
jgi:hypothetical protein